MPDNTANSILRGQEPWYWPGLFVNTASYYLKMRRPIAGVRALLRVLGGDNSEQCQRCGRGYIHWRADDALYELAHGNCYGTLCPRCFDREAETRGITLLWKPVAQ